MTQQVHTGYRDHRKAAWGLALLLVAAIAATTIPLASGASPNQTLRFVGQPTSPLQSSTPATSTTIAVAVFSGGPNPMNSNPPPTPSLDATGAGGIGNFDVLSGPTYISGTKYWTWSVRPKSTAISGLYNFVATLGDLSATSNAFRVAQYVCPPSCDGTSNFGTAGQGKLKIANTLGSPIALDFQPGGVGAIPAGCTNTSLQTTWNRAYYLDANGDPVYFPAVALDFTSGPNNMLQVTYMVRNSQWVLTAATRGNQDIDFCAEARHQKSSPGAKFVGKYGDATFDTDTGMWSGVLATVSNPSKVKTDPAVCAHGSQDISGETWRTWTICIPYDWDWGVKPG
jgi:hypothetical protein